MSDREPRNEPITRSTKFPVMQTLPADHKLSILFAVAGFKPMGVVDISRNVGVDRSDITSLEMKREMLVHELESLGLSCVNQHVEDKRAPTPIEDGSKYYIVHQDHETISFAKNKDNLTPDAYPAGDPRWAIAYGYPQTAMDAFPSQLADYNDLPAEITNDPLYPAMFYRMSKEHYPEEWRDFKAKALSLLANHGEVIEELNLTEMFKNKP